MKGRILNYSDTKGVISADDENRYEFSIDDWESKNITPRNGMRVDFVLKENRATGIFRDFFPSANSAVTTSSESTSTLAVVSLATAIFGLIFPLTSIVAIICGHIAKSEIKASNGALSGNGLATAGLILGYLPIVAFGLIFFLMITGLTTIAVLGGAG